MNSALVYGPVPSRRLGRSLGINNIPPKICSYSCVYCQLRRTKNMQITRETFYPPLELVRNVTDKVRQLREKGEIVDYLAFVPDGEPTLDVNLGKEIELLRPLGIKIAVITNSSLIWRQDVQHDLCKADWISLKVDAVTQDIWRKIDHPHGAIKIDNILDGMLNFAGLFRGELATETMLIKGINDSENEINEIAAFLAKLKPARAYISIPTRPPAERVEPATEQTLNTAYQIFSTKLANVEYLIGYEGNIFAFTGSAMDDLLSITAVHPMREDAVAELLAKDGADWGTIQKLVTDGHLAELEYRGKKFYARKLQTKKVFDNSRDTCVSYQSKE